MLQRPAVFQTLVSLTLLVPCYGLVDSMLDPVVLPSLRALALMALTEPSPMMVNRHSRFFQLLDQLEVLSIGAKLSGAFEDILPASVKSRTLVDCSISCAPSLAKYSKIEHLRIYDLEESQLARGGMGGIESQLLFQFASIIADDDLFTLEPSTTLRSIYLEPSMNHPTTYMGNLQVINYFEMACRCAKIEIVYEEQPGRIPETAISEEFWKRQRGIKEMRKEDQ
jgi:hypothetical protein